MKHRLFIFLLFISHFTLTAIIIGCQREEIMPEATSAAKEVYLQYADRKDLTVALIGGYQGYNAVMLQAQTNEGWLRLCEELGVKKNADAAQLDSTRVSSLTIMSHTSSAIGDIDSFFSEGDALLQRIVDSVIRDAIRTGKMPCNVVVDTAYSYMHREHYDNNVLMDSSTVTETVDNILSNNLLQIAQQHGDSGYIIRDDSEQLTLWLFFYSTPNEKEQILGNVTSTNTTK